MRSAGSQRWLICSAPWTSVPLLSLPHDKKERGLGAGLVIQGREFFWRFQLDVSKGTSVNEILVHKTSEHRDVRQPCEKGSAES